MRHLCRVHGSPLYIHIAQPDGRLRRSSDRDRKDIVLDRILSLALQGEHLGPTIYAQRVVSEAPLPSPLTTRARIHYGQYDKKNPALMRALRDLTHDAFRSGMIARLVLRDFWTAGRAPTLRQFAQEWLRATADHTEPRPEGAYLLDRHHGTADDDWKALRRKNASTALAILAKLTAERRPNSN
jgi:hypothetical protein